MNFISEINSGGQNYMEKFKKFSSKVIFSSLSDTLIICYLAIIQIKKVPQGCLRGNQA